MKIIKNIELVSFSELMLWNNKNISEVALLCGKSERTIRDYKKNNKKICLACRKLLIWLFYGIPQIDTWKDWKIRSGELIAPSGKCFTSKHLTILPILHQWRREIEAEKNKPKLKASLAIKKMSYF